MERFGEKGRREAGESFCYIDGDRGEIPNEQSDPGRQSLVPRFTLGGSVDNDGTEDKSRGLGRRVGLDRR